MYAYFKIHVLVHVHVLLHRLTRIMLAEHFHDLFTVKKHSIVKSIHIRPMTLEISVSTLGKGGREGERERGREGGREGGRERGRKGEKREGGRERGREERISPWPILVNILHLQIHVQYSTVHNTHVLALYSPYSMYFI